MSDGDESTSLESDNRSDEVKSSSPENIQTKSKNPGNKAGKSAIPKYSVLTPKSKGDPRSSATKPCKLEIPKLSASTPLAKFDKNRLDLAQLQSELNKLVDREENSPQPTKNKAEKDTEDSTTFEFHTPESTTPINSPPTSPGDITLTNKPPGIEPLEGNKSPVIQPDLKYNQSPLKDDTLGSPTPKKLIFDSSESSSANPALISITAEIGDQKKEETPTGMALTSAQYSDIIPPCKEVKDVEQFVTIVDDLYKEVENDKKKVFLAITRAKITGKAFDAIKGKDTSSWALLKDTLTKGLEEKVDMSTASNKLTHIKQLPTEELKEYIERIKDALAVLNRTAIRQFTDETVKIQILALNDATAKNTFEAGLLDTRLKTVVVAAQKATFNDSYNFATNQQHTNFPAKKIDKDEKKSNPDKKINCFKCGKPNHYANECYSNKNRFRSRSLPGRSNNFQSFTGNPSTNVGTNSSANRYYNNIPTSFDNRNNRPFTATNNFGANGNSANRGNWGRPTQNSGFNQNKPPNAFNSNNNTNRGSQAGNKPLSSNRNAIRVIREDQIDWDEIIPFTDSTPEQGNE
jgi:hypothetical protein